MIRMFAVPGVYDCCYCNSACQMAVMNDTKGVHRSVNMTPENEDTCSNSLHGK